MFDYVGVNLSGRNLNDGTLAKFLLPKYSSLAPRVTSAWYSEQKQWSTTRYDEWI